MKNGYYHNAVNEPYEEIPLDLYLTPPAPSDDEEVDPMVELAAMEREEAEREAMQAEDKPAKAAPIPESRLAEDTTTDDDDKRGCCQVSPTSLNDGSPMQVDDDGYDAASEAIPSVTDSEDMALSSPDATDNQHDSTTDSDDATTEEIEQESDNGDLVNDNDAEEPAKDEEEDDVEVIWSGFAPQWVCDPHADAANALLVHACSCDAPRCRDPAFGVLCRPMKRLLRSACWASHNRTWLTSGMGERVAQLLGYHSLHCDARSGRAGAGARCMVPLCDELSRA